MRVFKTLVYLISFIFSTNLWSQGVELTLSDNDSLKLNDTWLEFKKAVSANDTVKIIELSMDSVNCYLCITMEQSIEFGNKMPVSRFIEKMNEDVFDQHVWKAIDTKSYSILAREFMDYQPEGWDKTEYGNFNLIEVIYVTREMDEWKGYEGQSYLFQFVRINGQFKFYGVETIP